MNRLKLARFLLLIAQAFPKRYPLKSEKGIVPFFIFSAGRSGSTVLNRMLNEHPQLGLPTEQYFLGPALFKFQFYNYMIWRDLIQVIVGELWDKRKHTWDLDMRAILKETIALAGTNRTLEAVIDRLFRYMVNKQYWGDSTPLNTVYFKEIYNLFPNAKYIFLIRDGRDVVASYKSGGQEAFGDLAQVDDSVERWLLHAKSLRWYESRVSILQVKYEALMENPETELEQICSFLGVKSMPKTWRAYVDHIPPSAFFNPSHHDAIRKEPFVDSIGKWKSVLSKEEAEFCHRAMKSQLKEYGYH